MGEHNNGPYEQQLLAVFESCLMKGQTELKEEDLSSLCNKLQLHNRGDELKECIKKCTPGKRSISFQEFRGGLLLLLGKTQELLTQGDTDCTIQLQQEVNINNDNDKISDFPNSEIQESHMNDSNTKTGLILDKNRLKDLWQKMNVCFKENADTAEKYYMSNHRETSALPKQIAQRIFEKLDQNSDGLISLDEFLDIFKNQTILQEELILPCKDISSKCLTNSNEEKSDYDTLQHRDSGFIQHNIVTDMWKMAGISDAASLLSDLGYNSSSINLSDLVTTLCDELKSLNDSIINTDIQPHISLLKGVFLLYKEELRNLNILIENITGERDKLRVDVIEANERANSLAQEIDEHHFRQEEIKQNLLKQIEYKHSEIIKDLSNQLSLERESNATTLKVKEQQLQTQQQENYQNKNKLLTALQDNQILETENENLRNQIDKLKESNNELLMQIKMLAAEHDEVDDIDAKKEEQVLHLIDRMKQLQSEIVSLRDQNDELTIKLEISRSRDSETNLRAIKNEAVDATVTSETNTNVETTSQKEEILSCSNGINEKVELLKTEIDTIDNKEQIIKDLKNMLIKCGDCSCENCDYKDAISSVICGQSKFNSFSLTEEIDFSKSLASELETECEERTSESLRDFVVSKCNKTTSAKRVMHNSNDTMICSTDTNCNHADIKSLQNKITSLRDYPPRKDEYSITDHMKNLKEKDITSNHSVPCNESDKKNNTTLSNSDNSLTNLVSQEQENWWQTEKKQLTERCLELEGSLDLLKAEYEECEDYWAAKLEEERQLFEQEQKISDEKFSELIAKMAEYEEMISPVDKVKNGGRLSPIEEKFNLEQQYLDLEEEFEQWKVQTEKDILEKDKEIKSLFEKLKYLERPEKIDISIQVSDESIFQRSCTFCNHIPMDSFNVESYMQLQPRSPQYDGNTSKITENFKGDHIFENSMPSNHFMSQVIEEESCVENCHLNQLPCINKADTNNVYKCEKSESGEKKTNNISECTTFTEKEDKKSKFKHSMSRKENNLLIQELIKSQTLNSLHCQGLQDIAQQQVCNIDINILENLNMKLQIQERKKRQLEEYFIQRQHHIEQVLHQTLSQHQIEVSELRCLLYNTQEKLQIQIQANTEQAKRLAGADMLAKDLFIENAYLIANLKRLKQHCLLSGVNYESTSIGSGGSGSGRGGGGGGSGGGDGGGGVCGGGNGEEEVGDAASASIHVFSVVARYDPDVRSIDASKSTKGASKLRRDLINAEIANLRDLLPLPPSTRQRLSQLQLMALVCVFLRKANYFQQALKNCPSESSNMPTPNIGFSKCIQFFQAMSGFIMMMTQQGKLLYISENAAEYLGHSMEDLLIHGDSVYDVIDKQDHIVVQNQLARNSPAPNDRRLFLCRINVSRNSRRQLRFGDQKVVLVEGHFLPFVPVCNRNEFVFLASCTPVVLPETRESIVQGATNIFTTIHSMDMKYLHIDKTAESHMEYNRSELVGVSWYNLLHWDSIRTAYCKHQTVIQSDQERSSTALLRLQSRSGRWFWVHCVLQVKETSEECQHPIIVCTNQVLSDREAEVMRSSSWLYQYSSQAKFTYGICSTGQTRGVQYTVGTQSSGSQQQQEYVRSSSLGHSSDAEQSPSICNLDQESHRSTKTEPVDYPSRLPWDDVEPVDMSIGSAQEHDNRNLQFHSQHGNHHHGLGQFSGRYHKSHQKSSLHLAGYRAKFVQYHGQFSSGTDTPKYYITDLDKEYGCTDQRSTVHKRLPTKVLPASITVGSTAEPVESSTEHWSSSPAWSDALQRVPDVVHQELSPYITTPTTPADTPDSDLHSEAPIFNFDWAGEQHVPNLKITFRSSNHEPKDVQDVQPITLQLPRRKGHSGDESKDFAK
ncbi:uncharacterized protein LOC124951724 [Vespa velutina]|uniref:uncharacterized protein LOC124951724 n=1 Tax=Vespa velutina TaxID=202808 RepID=UPI001FB33D5F|nr:uncharacterized protein LOC124951724 [Vespa velutina]